MSQNFNCLGASCPNNCCGIYAGITPNLQNIGKTLFSEIILLPDDELRLHQNGYTNLIVRNEDGFSCISTATDGTCSAFYNGRCTIYDFRPSICRAYPLYLDMYTGVCLLKECPCVTESASISDFSDNLQNLLNVYQYWIDYYKEKYKLNESQMSEFNTSKINKGEK